ncbi:VOC family protein [Novosphingobium album (ex Liu et al. 2023)]|uniref:Lactoylglutathione lyase n=1 Tax=Novosphingobium album (ex Liu et al. 2023) TaxID=3031130 RepID=A0ABT5WPI7_9SPHN|nr:VOC family protein [Novosphingobium album (ex Liu et al. 2023)]MDE8651966.1 lactoylglutathione lyase [Novosphingobium album (ex Liu et al. 2023)]
MNRMIFVNLPVVDLGKSMRFYEALGFVNEPKFSDETAACMVWSENIFVMILTHPKWATFTDRPIPDTGSSEVALCLSCESRDEVNAMAEAAGKAGGIIDVNPVQEHGFMMSRSFADPDGHVWEPMWMDPAAAESGPPAEAAA